MECYYKLCQKQQNLVELDEKTVGYKCRSCYKVIETYEMPFWWKRASYIEDALDQLNNKALQNE